MTADGTAPGPGFLPGLTSQERAVAMLLAGGFPPERIAGRLGVPLKSVEYSLNSACAKTGNAGPGSRERLVQWVIRQAP